MLTAKRKAEGGSNTGGGNRLAKQAKSNTGVATYRTNPLVDASKQQPYHGFGPYREERIAKLMKHKINVQQVHAPFRAIVLHDFVDDTRKHPPQKLMETVRKAKEVFLFQAYFPQYAWKLKVFEKFKATGWTEVDLAMDYPNKPRSLVLSMLDGKQGTTHMLQIAGRLVGSYLAERDKNNYCTVFREEPFVDEMIEEATSPFLLGLWLEKHTKQTLSKRGIDPSVYARLNNRVVRKVHSRLSKYPHHPEVGKQGAVETLVKLATQTPQRRRQELKKALKSNGLGIRPDSNYCERFIQGTVGAQLLEVVGVMKIAQRLLQYSHIVWSENAKMWKSQMRQLVFVHEETWKEAWTKVIARDPSPYFGILTRIRRTNLNNSDDTHTSE